MNSDTTDSAVKEEDIGDITTQKQSDITINIAWHGNRSLKEIVDRTGLKIEEVNRRLKLMLKAKVEHGVENHGDENNS